MSELRLYGETIAGGGLTVAKMTEAQYLANKTALDSSDILVMITDVDPSVADGESVVYNSDMNFEDIGNIATKAIAKVEPSNTALYLHPVGDGFINKDGNYCITDVQISIGGTITLGTNCHLVDGGISSNLSGKSGSLTPITTGQITQNECVVYKFGGIAVLWIGVEVVGNADNLTIATINSPLPTLYSPLQLTTGANIAVGTDGVVKLNNHTGTHWEYGVLVYLC